jgi:thiosulfate/3-mercaptopyruvate sulfurtransferase
MSPALAPFLTVAEFDRLRAGTAPTGTAPTGTAPTGTASVVIVDTRWYLDGRAGAEAHAAGHVPGAVFVDLDRWLAGPPSTSEGRHPLPEPSVFARGMTAAGISDNSTVVVYDDAGGVIAARLVWMLRALGLDAAVLDGGLAAWQRAHPGAALETGTGGAAGGASAGGAAAGGAAAARGVSAASFTERPWPAHLLATIDETQAAAADGTALVLDARTIDRYRGETEPVDARPGHIPGAASLSCRDNVAADGTLLDTATLRDRLSALGARERPVISYCGSGVTACHTLLVLEQVGLAPGRLYPGSWSQYAADPDRPVATAN